jgi:pilus assembly protein CpaD
MASYDAAGAAPVITVSYPRYKARGPECGRSWENLSSTHGNRPYDNFGCAVTANFAAQIANPADLLAPRALDAPDGGRRQVVLDKYRKGEISSTAKDQQASGAVSNVVQ